LKQLEALGLITVDRRFLRYGMRLISFRNDNDLSQALQAFHASLRKIKTKQATP
jgi:hypothetical protein